MQSNSMQIEPKPNLNATTVPKSLRWWPAAFLIIGMIVLRFIPNLFEAPGLPIYMLAFMGPSVLGGAILLWWLFASRTSWSERLFGFFAMLTIAVASILALDKTMQGMGPMFFSIPAGCGAFGAVLVLLANRPLLRLPAALFGALIGFGVWTLVQSTGVTGKFDSQFQWRWSPTSEEKYLTSLKSRSDARTAETGTATEKSPSIDAGNSPWPAFRGVGRDGKLSGVTVSEDWKSKPPKALWKTQIGPGWSSFSYASNRLFTQEQRGEKEAVVCLNADTGATVWAHEYSSRFWEALAGAGPRATPTISEHGLFTMGADGILTRLDLVEGKPVWQRDLKSDADRKPPMWGFSASPLVYKNLVIIHAGGKGTKGILAYDVSNGEPVWSVESGDHSYSSPQLATLDGTTGILMETNLGLQFISPENGEKIWDHEWKIDNYRAIQPLVQEQKILIGTSLGGGTRCINVSRTDGKWNVDEAWTSRDMKPDFNDFVYHNGFVFGFDGDIFACVGLDDGKRRWKKGRYGNGQVLLLSDAGQLIVLSEKGEIVLLKADGSQFLELGKVQAIEGKTWNHPVVIGNRIFVRNGEEAACFELPTSSGASL